MKKTAKTAFIATIPVLTGYIALGIGFGILLRAKGFGLWWAVFMSVFIYAGSMQYLAIDLMAGGASLLTAALTTLLVNVRHVFYGISMVDKYADAGKKKPYLIFALTDETYSLLCGADPPPDTDRRWYYFFVSLFDQCYWITGCTLGAALGPLITFDTTGIDFVLTALFVTIFVEQWMSTRDHRFALVGVGASVVCLLLFGAESFLIPSMAVIAVALTLMRKKEARR